MERELKESELRFRMVADFAYDWETWLSPQNEYLYVSPSCKRITGYRAEDFIASPSLHLDILVPDDREKVEAHLGGDHGGRNIGEKLEFRIIRPDNTIRWVEHICQPVFSADGEYLGRRACNRDITCRKKIEEERDRLIEDLQNALAQVKKLSGLLPICSFCKKIRDDKGYWNKLEAYIVAHSEAQFTHSLCLDCAKKHYPDLFEDDDNFWEG
jgi:PAS domain S-box-containing protein